ncbi:YggS family pyridoxal phosphate-dependent enzyme [Paenibacillus chitinolyticus]|uniref:YggS family pyridoxal phosphate-dependent enzyme n=1 Tax=Paenibacillus chitinolyticus TaxID=79263 RepID=UPI0036DA2157
MNLQARIEDVHHRIEAACRRSGRSPEDINVIAVTKYVSLEATREALDHGLTQVGENRWQDAKEKWEALGDRGDWHFIGHLQTNKVKDIIGKFAYIHSLDRASLAKELEKEAAKRDLFVKCFIQVNVSGEESKYGLPPEELESFTKDLKQYPHLQIVGLMTMAPLEAEAEATRPVFRKLRELRDALNAERMLPEPLRHLSMGMSGDFEVAIEEGATWVRLGTVLVGKS